MPSLNFEIEEGEFRRFYDEKAQLLGNAKNSYIALITALVKSSDFISVSKIEGRVKDRDECIKKFKRKYLMGTSKNHLSKEFVLKLGLMLE